MRWLHAEQIRQKQRWIFLLFATLLQVSIHAQESTASLTGTVLNEKGDAMQGVTVLASRTSGNETFTTITNAQGMFTFPRLKVGSTYSFTSSYVGYEPNTVAAFTVKAGSNSLLVKMASSSNTLDQVVVIGYGTQKREAVTSSIATVRAEDFNKGVISDPLTLISGKVAGLAITRPNGSDPNATADFSLRGAVSVEGTSQPLVVIDGVPGGDINTIAPADIASIDVLRDGSAAAIYGSRATGGVIIVTTKRGTPGPVKVNYNGYVSTETIAKKYDVLTGDQYRAAGGPNDKGANTDWFKALTKTPVNHGHNLSFGGGSGRTTYNASLNYQNYGGIDLVTSREFVNATVRMTTKAINDKLDFSILLANSYDNKNLASASSYYGFGQALNINPTYPVHDSAGNFFETPQVQNQWNPVANTVYNTSNQKEKRLLGTASLGYSILPSLKANVSYSLNKIDFINGYYTNSNLSYEQTSGLNGQASRNEQNTTDNILETTLEWNKRFKNHSFDAIAGYSYQDEFSEGFGAGNNNFTTNSYLYNNLGAGSALSNFDPNAQRGGVSINSFANEWTLLSYFGRIIYNYKEKYLFNASIRREGASKLGADNKWGNFPGVSGGWIVSKESFMQGIKSIKSLKLRGGYGVTGNQGSLQPYQSLATIGPYPYATNQGYVGTPTNGSWVVAYGPSINPNPDLRWETKYELDLGVDFALFKSGWLSGSFDYYSRNIKNLIGNYNAQVPSQIWTLIFANAGNMTNKGVELSLNARIVKSRNFTWNANFVSSYNQNKIVSVSNNQFFGTAHDITDIGVGTIQRMAPGQPVNVFYGKVFAGFTADSAWLFKNNEGKAVTADQIGDNDYKYLGNSVPKYNLGLTNNFVFHSFDLSFLLRSALSFKAVNAKRIFHENLTLLGQQNQFKSALTSPVHDAPTFSSYYLENGNYVKLDNLSFGYTLPLHKNAYLQRIRFAATATNLFIITKFSGMDPELGVSSFNYSGVERNDYYYPRTRSFTFSINADF